MLEPYYIESVRHKSLTPGTNERKGAEICQQITQELRFLVTRKYRVAGTMAGK